MSWEARFPWNSGPSGWSSVSPGWFWLCEQGHRPAGTRRDIIRQQSPFSASPWCQGLLHVLLGVEPLFRLKEVEGHDVTLAWDDTPGPWRRLKIWCSFRAWVASASSASWFWSKTFVNGNPGALQSPMVFLWRAKLLAQLHEFPTLPKYFCN